MSREIPFRFIRSAIDLFQKRGGSVIVEIGSMRAGFDHPVEIEPETCRGRMDGHSTAHFASTGSEFHTVDIDKSAADLSRQYTKQFPNTRVVQADALDFLARFNKKIDLLFLDAWDVGVKLYAENHLNAYVLSRGLLSEKALILVDDCDVDNGGKGKLVVPQAIEDGWKILLEGRAVLLSRNWRGEE